MFEAGNKVYVPYPHLEEDGILYPPGITEYTVSPHQWGSDTSVWLHSESKFNEAGCLTCFSKSHVYNKEDAENRLKDYKIDYVEFLVNYTVKYREEIG